MSDPVFVYAPGSGEPFECSKLNARDLVEHAGWSYGPPAPAAPAETPVVEEAPKATKTAKILPVPPAAKPEVKIEEVASEQPKVTATAAAATAEPPQAPEAE